MSTELIQMTIQKMKVAQKMESMYKMMHLKNLLTFFIRIDPSLVIKAIK